MDKPAQQTIVGIHCPICDSRSTSRWGQHSWVMPGSQKEFYYNCCTSCGTIFCDPLPSGRELASYYQSHFNYVWFEERLLLKKIQAAHRWQRTRSLLHKYRLHRGQMLDIGCGHGLFLSRAHKAKWQTMGVERPSIASHYAHNNLGLTIEEGDLRTIITKGKILTSQFNLITAWHCLEHETEPSIFLKGIAKVLAPNGKVLIAVPNVESLGMRILNEDWVWCQQPFVHIFHYSQQSLISLVQRSGLSVLATWTRNTWDANPAYDIKIGPKLKHWTKNIKHQNPRTVFWIEEALRLICYLASCYKHWLLSRERGDDLGSELLILAEKRDCNQLGPTP